MKRGQEISRAALCAAGAFLVGFAVSSVRAAEPEGVSGKTLPFRQKPFAWHVTPRHDYSQTFVTKLFMSQALFDPETLGRFKMRDNGKQTNYLTCEQALEIIRQMDAVTLGKPKIVYLVGWQYNGHDSKYPAFFEGNPAIKRPCDRTALESLRWLMTEARRYHTAVSLHVNMFDAYPDSPLFEEYRAADVLAKDKEGRLLVGDWGNKICFAAEWAKGLAQKRLDRLCSLLPIAEAGTLHIDAFHTSVPRPRMEGNRCVIRLESPISPGHGYSEQDEIKAQQNIVRYLDAKGIDVTIEGVGEFGAGAAFDGYIPMYYHYGDFDHNLTLRPQQATGVNVYGGLRCFGTNLNGEQLFKSDRDLPHAMKRFTRKFCHTTLAFHFLNRFVRTSITCDNKGNAAGVLEKGVRTLWKDGRLSIFQNGKTLMADGDLLLPAPWRGANSVIAFSEKGCANQRRPLPDGVTLPADVAAWTVTPQGRKPFGDFKVADGTVTLTLAPGQMVLLERP